MKRRLTLVTLLILGMISAALAEEAVILTPKPRPEPRINGARVFGVRPGSPFLFTVPVTGERPIAFAASGLPEGLVLDPATGRISGRVDKRGEYVVDLKAANARGTAESKLKIVCGDTLALTPHMGWNSWYVWENHVTDAIMRAAADAMVASGMAGHGYMYVNIDDCWSVKPGSDDPTLQGEPRDKRGMVNSNPRFPDMKALTDYIHAKGLKAGIYTSPGPLTCAGHTAAYEHEKLDAERFVEWGYDFLKYDWCSYDRVAKDRSVPELQKPYRLISGILASQPRDIVLNLCQYGMGNVWEWGAEVGGNSWRTAGDLGGSFEGIPAALFRDGFDVYSKNELHRYGGPGHWNDPDYLLLGYLSDWKGGTAKSPLTPNEQYTHVSLWALVAAPLIFSGDITRLDDFTLGLLTNDEVIDIDQDALGRPGRRVAKNGDLEVWVRDMEDGSKAVGLFNRGEGVAEVKAEWSDLGIGGKQVVRDVWRQQDVGVFEGAFPALVARHGVVLVRVRPAESGGPALPHFEGCTVIGVGRLASADGSVMTSHTDCSSECRIQVVPGRTFPKGAMAPVHWGMVYFGADDERHTLPLGDFGKVIGEIPQVERTFAYFHTGYSQMNEKQLAIGESTCSEREELHVPYVEGVTRQIMTIEQAQVFALERCTTAREAVKLIGGLVEKYGFLPSCGGSEALCIADPKELWEMEVCGVGTDWAPGSGKPGAIWAARRVGDDQVVVIANHFRLREIDLKNPDMLASANYMKEAVDRGWYDPKSGKPFIWSETYSPAIREGSLSRMWLIYSTVAPSYKAWPRRTMREAAGPGTLYAQPIEGDAFYPFSVKPEKKLSVRDVIAFQRSTFENTIYDMTLDPAWSVSGGGGKVEKSPMASPFVGSDWEQVLRIRHHRTIAGPAYGMVAQLRSWLPDAVGGIYWFYVDNPFVSAYVPVYAGVTDVAEPYKIYDYSEFSEGSARWTVHFVEKLMLLRWQSAVKDLREARDPVENAFFDEQAGVDAKAAEMIKAGGGGAGAGGVNEAAKYLTELTKGRMDKVVKMFRELRNKLLTKYAKDVA